MAYMRYIRNRKGTTLMESFRFWAWFSVLCLAAGLFAIMSVTMTIRAHAQEAPACMPYEDLTKTLA